MSVSVSKSLGCGLQADICGLMLQMNDHQYD